MKKLLLFFTLLSLSIPALAELQFQVGTNGDVGTGSLGWRFEGRNHSLKNIGWEAGFLVGNEDNSDIMITGLSMVNYYDFTPAFTITTNIGGASKSTTNDFTGESSSEVGALLGMGAQYELTPAASLAFSARYYSMEEDIVYTAGFVFKIGHHIR